MKEGILLMRELNFFSLPKACAKNMVQHRDFLPPWRSFGRAAPQHPTQQSLLRSTHPSFVVAPLLRAWLTRTNC